MDQNKATSSLRIKPVVHAISSLMAFASLSVHALTVGPVEVLSKLGSPLSARAEISEATLADLNTLVVELAQNATYERFGITPSAILDELQIELDFVDKKPMLLLTSKSPIEQKAQDILFDVTWATGRQTYLKSLIINSPNSAPATVLLPTVIDDALSTTENQTVQPGDTATKFAEKFVNETLTLEQALVALVRHNPDAFIGQDINQLKAGSSLRMPSSKEIANIPKEEAQELVVRKRQEFAARALKLANSPMHVQTKPEVAIQGLVAGSATPMVLPRYESDKLTLTKGVIDKSGAEEKLRSDLQMQADKAQMDSIDNTIKAMEKLSAEIKAPVNMTVAGVSEQSETGLHGWVVWSLAGALAILAFGVSWIRLQGRSKQAPSNPVKVRPELSLPMCLTSIEQAKLDLAVELMHNGEKELANSLLLSIPNRTLTAGLLEKAQK